MSENDNKSGTSAESREEIKGLVGPAMTSTDAPRTKNISQSHAGGGAERLGPTAGLGTNTGAGGLTTITSDQQDKHHVTDDLKK
ncbi:unnamed protein product [Rotaria sordida]|uniref:Uncharacterized protein n=1 Tax=Rotaria sordida TaxID=392033 RepID=A0A813WII1_9BILA|nr:unnamed protein product [Rotaria sordida]CAF3758050.1 unnamed protein product [Rotaria sordida]